MKKPVIKKLCNLHLLAGVKVEVLRKSSSGTFTVKLIEDAPDPPAYKAGSELHVNGYQLADVTDDKPHDPNAFKVYTVEHVEHGEFEYLSDASACAAEIGGYVNDCEGNLVYGKKPVGTIDLTPTWQGWLPYLLELYEGGKPSGRAMALEELKKMAALADRATKRD